MRLAIPVVAFVVAATVPLGAQSRRDSAGVTIVENTSPVMPPARAPRLAAKPTLVIGGASKSGSAAMYEFRNVAGAAVLSDGSIAVADGASRQIRIFDRDGRFVRAMGGPGGGPGEFERLAMFARLPGDTLVGADFFSASYLTADGKFAYRIMSMRAIEGTPPGQRLFMSFLRGGASVIGVYPRPAPRAVGARWVEPIPLFLLEREATTAKSIGSVPAFVFLMQGAQPDPLRLAPQGVFATNGDEFFYGFGDRYSISVYARTGQITRIIRRAWTPVRTRGLRDTGDGPVADTVAAFSQFIADRSGRLWVRAVNIGDNPPTGGLEEIARVPNTWTVFDATGRWLMDVTMPARFAPMDIGSDYVLGMALGEDDIETIVRFPIVSPR